jgi:Leucine carboxyl methyltransferase
MLVSGPGRIGLHELRFLWQRAGPFGSHESDSTVRNPDWMVERIIGPAELDLIRDHPIVDALKEDYDQARQRIEVAGSSNLMLIRTRFIDDCLERAVRDGIRQLVILGGWI